ncbi:MAG: hypothetical protein LQ348_007363 [Seirophora lacunosa]|nr:MAG: hypothetical protein LQ348_007363 [Seirophora lacunosa]
MSSTGQEPSPATEPARPTPPDHVCPFCSQCFSRDYCLRRHLDLRQHGGACARVPVTTATEKCEVCLKLFTTRGLSYHVNKRLESGACPRQIVGKIAKVRAVDEEGKNGELGSKEVNPDILHTRDGGLTLDTGTAEDLRPVEASDSLQARTLVQTPTDSGTQQNLPTISKKCSSAKKGVSTCLYPHCFASFSTREGMLRHVADHGAKHGTTGERCPEGCNMSVTHVHPIGFEAHLETKHAWCVICNIGHVSMARLVKHYRDVHRLPSPICPHEGCGEVFESYEEMLKHYWRFKSHPKVIFRQKACWECPFCGVARSFRYKEGAMMHFKTFHGLAPTTEESTEVRMADEETQSSAETMAGTGTYSSMETGVGGGTSSSMDTYLEASTYSSMDTGVGGGTSSSMDTYPQSSAHSSRKIMEMMSIDSILNHDVQTEMVPASKAEQVQAQIGGMREKGVQLCDNPQDCYSCANLLRAFRE